MHSFGFPLETIIIFCVVIAVSLYLDLFAHRHSKEITLRDAALWSTFWVATSLAFYVYLYVRFSAEDADLFLAGYALEKALSIDNLMVFMAIFSSFAIKGPLQHRILYYGIIGALLFRALFVGVGTALLAASPWMGFLFAAIVAWSAWKMMTAGDHEDEIHDYSDHWSVRMTRRFLPVFPRLSGEHFFIRHSVVEAFQKNDSSFSSLKKAAWYATPAFLCLVTIETSDVMFAFDSVPAVIAVTHEPLLVYAAMIFAILGLRSLYFVLASLVQYLVHLNKAVIFLLYYIALKLAIQSSNHIFEWPGYQIPPMVSLMIVLGALALGVIASFIFPGKKVPKEDTPQ